MKTVGKNGAGKPEAQGSNARRKGDLPGLQSLAGNPSVVSRRHLVVASSPAGSSSLQELRLAEASSEPVWEGLLSESKNWGFRKFWKLWGLVAFSAPVLRI